MTTLPLADGAHLLGIHPKTLHHWLKAAQLPLAVHPQDARIKCVAEEHLHQVAQLHGRPFSFAAATRPGASQGPGAPPPTSMAEPLPPAQTLPRCQPPEADLLQKLSRLETTVATLQEQVTQLALALLQERERSVERRLATLETLIAEFAGKPLGGAALPPVSVPDLPFVRAGAPPVPRQLHPAEHLARSRRPPLIESNAQGTYVIISVQEGEVHVEPDSRAWFGWLATLSSFRFVSKYGRFTAHRGYHQGHQTHFWSASRCVRRHTYKHYLGVTESLTIASLERIAARLQSEVDAR